MHKKNRAQGHLPWFGFPWLKPVLWEYRPLLIGMLVTGTLCSVFDAVIPLFQRYAIHHFIGNGTLDGLWGFVLLYLLALLVKEGFEMISAFGASKMEVNVGYSLRKQVFDHLQKLSLSYYNQNGVGYIHARLISDVDRIGALCSWTLMGVVWDGGYMVYAIVIMLGINWRLGLLLLLMTPAEIALFLYFQGHLTRANRVVREINSRITSRFNEGITGAQTIRTLVAGQRVEQDFFAETERMFHAGVRVGRVQGYLRSLSSLAANVGLALVLWRGSSLSVEGRLNLASLSAFIVYALTVTLTVPMVASTLQNLINAQVNIERVKGILDTEPDVTDSPEVIATYGTVLEPKRENWEPLHGDITFRDVTFRYPDGEETVLHHFNLHVPQGTRVAIVGETGAGKSTLVNLVCRFFQPTEGQLLIDGRDARERSQLWLHAHIGYVLQTPYLFNGTVLENLRYGKPEATLEEVEAACRRVCADRVIARMEEGYHSQVGESGDLLSTGEKQLLSFARAILADPRILILDEATSSVDTLTEQSIQTAIEAVTRDRTSFIIAHRLSTIRDADVILMMKDGRILEQGTHAELMGLRGAYYHMYTTQFSHAVLDEVLNPGV